MRKGETMRPRVKIERDCELASSTCFDISDSEITAAQARLLQDIPNMLSEIALLKHTNDLAEEAIGFKNAEIDRLQSELNDAWAEFNACHEDCAG